MRHVLITLLAAAMAACMARPESESPAAVSVSEGANEIAPKADMAFDEERKEARPGGRKKRKSGRARTRGVGGLGRAQASLAPAPSAELVALDDAPEEQDAEAPTPARSWFPETFLFAPTVATDEGGAATLTVTVPDRLTTWRILAMAHDRRGGRGGTVATFDSVLPTYVDPVLPDALIAGDRIELPVMVVNTTDKPVERTLLAQARGAGLLDGREKVKLGPQRSVVRYIPVEVKQPGSLMLSLSLSGADKVERQVKVRPRGRPVRVERTGALADVVDLNIPLPKETRSESIEVGLTVFPGALALVRSELSSSLRRDGVIDAAYALRVAGTARPLIERLGGKIDPTELRKVRLRAGQTLLRAARRPSAEVALVLAHGAGAHPKDPLLGRLADRMAQQIATLQRPDGTFNFGSGWSLQRVVVATAEGIGALAAVADDEAGQRLLKGAKLRAEGAFERYIDAVKDPFTAAAILSVDGVRGALAEKLRGRVREGLTGKTQARLSVDKGVVGIDGYRPSTAHATALAVLALLDDPKSQDKLPGLGNTLLARYSASSGWGSGRANLAALRAVSALFKDPLPERVSVQLLNGDEPVVQTLLAGPQRTERHEARAWAPKAVGRPNWRVVADPPVPGLAFSVVVDYRVPWRPAPQAGVTLQAEVPKVLKVGEPAKVVLVADGPRGARLQVRYALPAGVTPMQSDLSALVAENKIERFSVDAGGVTLSFARRRPGTAAKAELRVVPMFAGQLQAEASEVSMTSRPNAKVFVAPKTWRIGRD